ncbi:MAG: glycosyltransferase family 2 protein [Candidatus Eremiobacteraeota bacterium]|nr:glycosyltransferase family 2 protein [Candidatus Eremiobacteraeota bacterium]
MTQVSVIIASKDRAAYLDQALRSLSEQIGDPSFEAIVIDNGSSDATPQVVDRAREAYDFEISYLYEERPNRAAARNRGITVAQGDLALFVDDDVWLPPGFLAAHTLAHGGRIPTAVSGPIINVPTYHDRPKPGLANFSRAFFCTCNVSVPVAALREVHGFDEQFHLYGWEDTELGIRLRESGVRAKFCWDAYLYHIKPPAEQTLDVTLVRTLEKAHMAARFIRKNTSRRARLATGAYPWNFWRARALAPKWLLPLYAGFAADERVPPLVRAVARHQLLDGMYVHELQRGLHP